MSQGEGRDWAASLHDLLLESVGTDEYRYVVVGYAIAAGFGAFAPSWGGKRSCAEYGPDGIKCDAGHGPLYRSVVFSGSGKFELMGVELRRALGCARDPDAQRLYERLTPFIRWRRPQEAWSVVGWTIEGVMVGPKHLGFVFIIKRGSPIEVRILPDMEDERRIPLHIDYMWSMDGVTWNARERYLDRDWPITIERIYDD